MNGWDWAGIAIWVLAALALAAVYLRGQWQRTARWADRAADPAPGPWDRLQPYDPDAPAPLSDLTDAEVDAFMSAFEDGAS